MTLHSLVLLLVLVNFIKKQNVKKKKEWKDEIIIFKRQDQIGILHTL